MPQPSPEPTLWESLWTLAGLPLFALGVATGFILAPFVSGLRIGLFGPKLWQLTSDTKKENWP